MRRLALSIAIQFVIPACLFAQTIFKGRVTDPNGTPLIGATIYFPDLKTGSATDLNGSFVISNLPRGRFLVQVKMIGYGTITEFADLTTSLEKTFVLKESVVEVKEVIVTGVSQATEKERTPAPITIISKSALLKTPSANIIEAVSLQPGMSQVSTGIGITKPVIRGLGGNRVLVVNDGIRQEGQQWGDEHGIEVDEYSVEQVEILKGPASLAYGSDALAGVVHFISTPSTEEGSHQGNIFAGYQTNNGLAGLSGNMKGNANGLIYSIRVSAKAAHAYQNRADGFVLNSGFRENSVNGIIGVNRRWGFSHLHMSRYEISPGIIEGERDSSSGRFVRFIPKDDTLTEAIIAGSGEMKKYKLLHPFQNVRHFKVVSVNSFVTGKGRIAATIGFQKNFRQEFADVLEPKKYELFFDLTTANYDFRYLFAGVNNFNFSAGVNGMLQQSLNRGDEFLVPEYSLFDAGFFAVATKTFERLSFTGGIRFDQRKQSIYDLYLNAADERVDAYDPSGIHLFKGSENVYRGLSGSAGATYRIGEIAFSKLNLSRGYRAPNIAEVGSNGVHEGALRYEVGDPKLNAEHSMQLDIGLGIDESHVTAEVDVFSNSIGNFIFPVKLNSVYGGDSVTGGMSTFKYISGTALLRGGELTIDVHPHPLDWIHFQNSFSYVQAVRPGMPDSMKYLPAIPPARYQGEIILTHKKLGKYISEPYIHLSTQVHFSQEDVFKAYNTETRTPAYTLVNAGVGGEIVRGERIIFTLVVTASNIFDVIYQSHLSRLKYAPINYASGRSGVFNMGRNFGFKVIVPFRY